MEETLFENPVLSIADLIQIPEARESKVLSEQAKRLILQREIFLLLESEDMRKMNWKRYCSFLKKHKIDERKLGREVTIRLWKKTIKKDVKPVRALSKSSFGFFTSHIKSDDLFALKSKVQDALNRGESPTCYIYSLSKLDSSFT